MLDQTATRTETPDLRGTAVSLTGGGVDSNNKVWQIRLSNCGTIVPRLLD